MGELLKATGVSCYRGKTRETLLDNIDLTVTAGQLIIIRGNSGVGKSTLIQLLAGVIRPAAGLIERYTEAAWVPQRFLLYQDLTVAENLDFFIRVNRFQGDGESLLNWAGLAERRRERAGKLPVGYKKMLQICVALTREAGLFLLDEPLVGLDQQQTVVLNQLLLKLIKAGKSIVVTQSGPTVSRDADCVYRLQNGLLTLEKSVATGKGEAGL